MLGFCALRGAINVLKARGQLRVLSAGPVPVGTVELVLRTILSISIPSSRSQIVTVCRPAGIDSVPGDDFQSNVRPAVTVCVVADPSIET